MITPSWQRLEREEIFNNKGTIKVFPIMYRIMVIWTFLRIIQWQIEMVLMMCWMMRWHWLITIHFIRTFIFHIVVTIIWIKVFRFFLIENLWKTQIVLFSIGENKWRILTCTISLLVRLSCGSLYSVYLSKILSISVDAYWKSLFDELKIIRAISQSHRTLNSYAFFIRPNFRFVNVTWRLRSSLIFDIWIFLRPILKIYIYIHTYQINWYSNMKWHLSCKHRTRRRTKNLIHVFLRRSILFGLKYRSSRCKDMSIHRQKKWYHQGSVWPSHLSEKNHRD